LLALFCARFIISKYIKDQFSLILEVPQALDDDEYEPFYPSEKLQLPYGMDIVRSLNSTTFFLQSVYIFF
jgi:hypothetical protein